MKYVTELQTSPGLAILSPALVLFLANHHLQSKIMTLNCNSWFRFQIVCITSFPELADSKASLMSSKPINLQHSFTPLHLKKRWPQSSSCRLHTGHTVSIFTPLLDMFLRTGKLLWANRQINILTLFGTFICQILCHLNCTSLSTAALDELASLPVSCSSNWSHHTWLLEKSWSYWFVQYTCNLFHVSHIVQGQFFQLQNSCS